MKKFLFLPLLISFFTVDLSQAMQREPAVYVDPNNYAFRDENTVQDHRRIAVLSYGSLVRSKTNPRNNAQLLAQDFKPSVLYFPIALARKSLGNRITAVIDEKLGEPKRVWYAESNFSWLPNARQNLASREGAPFISATKGYDLTNIFYMKKLIPGKTKDANEEFVPGSTRWVVRSVENERQKLSAAVLEALVRWAEANHYDAIIWSSFPPTIDTREATIQLLLNNDELLTNTQEYIRQLPYGAETGLKKRLWPAEMH